MTNQTVHWGVFNCFFFSGTLVFYKFFMHVWPNFDQGSFSLFYNKDIWCYGNVCQEQYSLEGDR